MALSSSSSSSSRKWVFDVFTSFGGEDVYENFLRPFFMKLDMELITAFKNYEMERSHSISPKLVQVIRNSRIAVVVFSKTYASSSLCLNELVEILKCKEELGQLVIPIFYDLDPSHLKEQSGDFGEAFRKTCQNQTEEVKNQWKQALTHVANIFGYHSTHWDDNTEMIETIATDVLGKLKITPPKVIKDFVGIKYHIEMMIFRLDLDSEEVRRVGIWGPSGIGKTTIAKSLYGLLSPRFQRSIFIDRGFVSKSMEIYRSILDYHDVKLRLENIFLSEILGKKHQKALIVIDDLDDELVLDALVGQTHWFGFGSRIIMVTNDDHLLRAYGFYLFHEVDLPSEKLALEMFCRYAFRQNYPPDGFRELASKVVLCAGNLPLALNVFGLYLRGRDKKGWLDMMPTLQNGLDEKIEKSLRVNYDGLNNQNDQALFRYIACFFSGEKVNGIKWLLADSDLDVNIGLAKLVDKSLLYLREDTIEMHSLLQRMAKEIVRAESNEPGEREFLMDWQDIRDVLDNNTGTEKVLGLALDIHETDWLHIHKCAFKGMHNLLFLKFYTKQKKEVRLQLPKEFDYFPPKVRLLCWDRYPLRCLPSKCCPEHLVKLEMRGSKLEKLWEGVCPLTRLKHMDLSGSQSLKEIPDLSMAVNLVILRLNNCSNLVELPSFIKYLNKLEELDMQFCDNLTILPTGINLQSLIRLDLCGCSRLKSFPDISTNILYLDICQTTIEEIPSTLRLEKLVDLFMDDMMSVKLWDEVQPLTPLMAMLPHSLKMLRLSHIPSLVELPSSFRNLYKLEELRIMNCINLEVLPTGINFEFLDFLELSNCSRLTGFPHISTNISQLFLENTAIEKVPWRIKSLSRLRHLHMKGCKNLKSVSINISNLKHLEILDFTDCGALTEVIWNDSPNTVVMAIHDIHSKLRVPDEVSSSLLYVVPKIKLSFVKCFNLNQEALYQKQAVFFKSLEISGEEVPSYFTHRTTGTSLIIPPLRMSSSQPLFRFRACVMVTSVPISIGYHSSEIEVCCLFIDKLGNQFDVADWPLYFSTRILGCHLVIFDCCFLLKEDNAHLAELNNYEVNIQFRLLSSYPQLKVKGCGIRLLGTEHNVGMSVSRNWRYDVFPSFRGEDVRQKFLSHFLNELDRKSISTFKDKKIEKSQSLHPVLKQAIKDSRIAVVVFSQKYASSSWCLNELLEIVNCKEEFGQLVIPIFYDVDPSHVRYQVGDFGEVFKKTCIRKTEEEIQLWRKALTDVANLVGYHSQNCDSEATMIEEIASDVLGKLLLTTSKDFEDLVGIEDHIAKMSVHLCLESEKVRMVGIWGSSGIGKTTIARALFNRFSQLFHSSVFIDRAFVSKSMEIYSRANTEDYNMKLHLQKNFLSEILGKKDITIQHLGALRERLKHQKVLIIIDDLQDPMVLDALVGETHWFGRGSRIIMVTKDKHLLRAREIDFIYEVGLPSEDLALKMLCRYAFKKDSPPDGLTELASEVAFCAGNLPLGLKVLGSYLWGRDKEDCIDLLPRLQNGLDGKIGKTMRISYNGLNNEKDKAIFRHIACLFNGEEINDIKQLLADSNLDINIGIKNLVDKSLIQVSSGNVEMHCLLQDMGKEIVRAQSNDSGEREFLMDWQDIRDVLDNNIGTKKILGISLDIDEIDELNIHVRAFENMSNLRFLKIYTKKGMLEEEEEVRLHVLKEFDYFPCKIRLLCWDRYPLRCLPSKFRPENLVKLQMRGSKLEKLWKGVCSLKGLKLMDLSGSQSLKEIPDLSMAVNLVILRLNTCSSLVELPSSIKYLNKLEELDMQFCDNLKILPTGINLQSLSRLNLCGCSRLKSFPDISTNILHLDIRQTMIEEIPSKLHLENLVDLFMNDMMSVKLWEGVQQPLTTLMTMLPPSLKALWLSHIPSLVELPSSFHNLYKLESLKIRECINLETLPIGINFQYLFHLNLSGCSRLKTFPHISTNISWLDLSKTGIEEVPWWIVSFSRLKSLDMWECNQLKYVSLNIYKLKHLETADFSYCAALTAASWNDSPSEVVNATDNTHSKLPFLHETVSSLPDNFVPKAKFNFMNCFNLDQEALLQQQSILFNSMQLSGEEVPSYFTHRTTRTSLIIHILHISPPQQFFKFKACAVVDSKSSSEYVSFEIQISGWFRDRLGNYFSSGHWPLTITTAKLGSQLVIFECCSLLNEDNARLSELSYDYLHLDFFTDYDEVQIKGCGIRLQEDGLSLDSQPCKSDILVHVCEGVCVTLDYSNPFPATRNEADESKVNDDERCETPLNEEEYGDNRDDESYETALDEEECGDNSDDEGYETALDEEECGDNSDDEGYETALGEEECGDNSRSY